MAPACGVLDAWLKTATVAIAVSPASRPAATVRQQLQDSRLLEHLGAGMDAAAALLTIAAAAAVTAASSSSRAAPKPLAKELSIVQLLQAECCCDHLLKTLDLASRVMSPTGDFSWEAALPATAGAVRLVLTVLKTRSRLQQQQITVTEQPGALQVCNSYSVGHHEVALRLLLAVAGAADCRAATTQAHSGLDDLLLSPDLLPFLATMLLVTVLGLRTSTAGGASAAALPASSGSTRHEHGSSTGPKLQGSQGRQLHSAHASSSRDAGRGIGSSSSGCSKGVQVESLTALSSSLFDILGVSKETALQAARLANSARLTVLPQLVVHVSIYRCVADLQVSAWPQDALGPRVQGL